MDCEVLDPGALAESDRQDVEIHGAEPDRVAIEVCDEHVRAVRGRDLVQCADGIRLVPVWWSLAGWDEQPFVCGRHGGHVCRPCRSDHYVLLHASTFLKRRDH
jgi:hypothetical protein